MLSRFYLKEYRLSRNLSLRDVARYCDVCHELIGMVERGAVNVTKYNHDEIVGGINAASQAIVNGTFEADKEKEKIEESTKLAQAKEKPQEKQTARKPRKPAKDGAAKKAQG